MKKVFLGACFTAFLILVFGGVWAQEGKLLPATRPDIEGPFYRPGAPFRSKLHEKGDKGKNLLVSGTVVNRQGQPLPGAIVDIWQANAEGSYDNDSPQFRFRGKVQCLKDGTYQFETIWPGKYAIGRNQYRPGHIHFKIHHPDHKVLTTQIYFKGDPFNKKDPFFHPDNEVDPKKDGERYLVTFRFVVEKKK